MPPPQASLFRPISVTSCPLPRLVGQALTDWATLLHVLPHFHPRPIYLVVSRGFTSLRMDISSEGASRLDAFSVYPFRTWLPGHGFGKPTSPPAVRPSRSSRTQGQLRYPTPTPDRDRTVSRRSEPSSRTA